MTTLTDFLLARIAEDEAVADQAARLSSNQPIYGRSVWNGIGHAPVMIGRRLAAECEAKRQIVQLHRLVDTDPYESWKDEGYLKRYPPLLACRLCKTIRQLPSSGREWPCETLRLVALVYSDHPDFDPAWRLP